MLSPGFVLQTGIMLLLALVEPFWGKRNYAELIRAIPHDPLARTRNYSRMITLEWGLLLLALLSVLVDGTGLERLGFRPLAGEWAMSVTLASGAFVGGLLLSVVMARLSPKARELYKRQMDEIGPLLPAPGRERWLFAGLSVTAGICEEVLFRGLVIAWLTTVWPGLSPLVLVLVSAVLFGLAHLYQGLRGVLLTGLLGGILAVLYLTTGSIYVPIILHALFDLRMLGLVWAMEGEA